MYKMDPIFGHPSVILFGLGGGELRSLLLRVTNKEYLLIPVILLRLLIPPFLLTIH